MALAVYVHIPYCFKRCRFCDFTVVVQAQKPPPPSAYIQWVKQEITHRHTGLKERTLSSVYFGGGTPSFIKASLLSEVVLHLKKYFTFLPDVEITVEVNPGTLTESSLRIYQEAGINRFSIGVQTFREDLLKLFNRGHTALDTHKTLKLLSQNKVVFSCDLLFALNHQSTGDLKKDLSTVLDFQPQHISTYYMNLGTHHPLQKNRPSEKIQAQMFNLIYTSLTQKGFVKYEISNFALPGFQSRHNKSYWLNKPYWGLGVSAHSFLKIKGQNVRFWNPKRLSLYQEQVKLLGEPFPFSPLPEGQKEFLKEHEALTDFCYTALRTRWGIDIKKLKTRFKASSVHKVLNCLQGLYKKGYLTKTGSVWILKPECHVLSEEVFRSITFLEKDLL